MSQLASDVRFPRSDRLLWSRLTGSNGSQAAILSCAQTAAVANDGVTLTGCARLRSPSD